MCVPLPLDASCHLLLGGHAQQYRPFWYFSPQIMFAFLFIAAFFLYLISLLTCCLFTCYLSVFNALDFLSPPSFPSLSATLFVFFAVPSLDCSSLVYFCRCLFAVVTGADYVGLSSFCPSHCLCPRSIMSFTFRAASH